MNKGAYTNTDWVRVIREYESGVSLRALAKKWHRSPETIKGYLEGDAVVLRPPAKYTPIPPLTDEAKARWAASDRKSQQVNQFFAWLDVVARTRRRKKKSGRRP